jgi:ADP-ribosyl-[dinitrogen reductase] hydrolase
MSEIPSDTTVWADQPYMALLRMLEALHREGYQRLRVYPYLSPSGAYWRAEIAPASAFHSAIDPPRDQGRIARYTTGNSWRFFDWPDARRVPVEDLAIMFKSEFRDLCVAGQGSDEPYAAWFSGLLPRAAGGELPIFAADWPLNLSRGVPMTNGREYDLPPPLPNGTPTTGPADQ